MQPPLHRRARGFGLLEIILVFAIIIGAAALVFTVFQSASLQAQTSNTMEKVNAIVANVQGSAFTNINQRTSLTTVTAKQAGILTSGLQTNAWGGAIEVSDVPALTPPEFEVVLRDVDVNACPGLLTAAMTNKSFGRGLMDAAGASTVDQKPFGGVVIASPLVTTITYAQTVARCSVVVGGAPSSTVDIALYFTYSGLHGH